MRSLINSVCGECTQLKDTFLFQTFAPFCVPLEHANSHVAVGVIRKNKMARNWFKRICVVFFYVS